MLWALFAPFVVRDHLVKPLGVHLLVQDPTVLGRLLPVWGPGAVYPLADHLLEHLDLDVHRLH